MDKKTLGIGLSELLKENLIFDEAEKIIEIEISKLKPNPYQPRKYFKPEAIKELTNSIKEFGVIQPIIVKQDGSNYIIIAGERRCKASKEAGLKVIPAVVRDYNKSTMAEVAILENLQRENLNILEEAEAYTQLIRSSKMTQEELAERLGKSRSYITNTIGLLKLPKEVQKKIASEGISMSHARVLSKIKDTTLVSHLATLVENNSISVREIEKIAREAKSEASKSEQTINETIKHKKVEKLFKKKLNVETKVSSNKITINFKDEEALDKIIKYLESIGE